MALSKATEHHQSGWGSEESDSIRSTDVILVEGRLTIKAASSSRLFPKPEGKRIRWARDLRGCGMMTDSLFANYSDASLSFRWASSIGRCFPKPEPPDPPGQPHAEAEFWPEPSFQAHREETLEACCLLFGESVGVQTSFPSFFGNPFPCPIPSRPAFEVKNRGIGIDAKGAIWDFAWPSCKRSTSSAHPLQCDFFR